MLMNNKSIMRTFEAIIAAVIMILGVSFILSDYGTAFSTNPSWEVIDARNSAEDILVILEKGMINNQSEIGYYISNREFNALDLKLQSLIPPGYAYSFNIFEVANAIYIPTQGEATEFQSGILTNGYRVGNLKNNNDIWKFHETETGWPGDYIIFFPDGGSLKIYGLLVVDALDEVIGYDTVYLKLEDGDPLDFSTSTTNLSGNTPLRVGDLVSFSSHFQGIEYEYTYQLSNIARDGNSISFALIDEAIYIDFVGTNVRVVSIFDDTFRLTLNEAGGLDTLDAEIKIGEPDRFTTYKRGLVQGTWTNFGNYAGTIRALSYDGVNGHLILNIVPYKRSIAKIEKPGEMHAIISAKRIVSIMDAGNVRTYYVSLVMGRARL